MVTLQIATVRHHFRLCIIDDTFTILDTLAALYTTRNDSDAGLCPSGLI
jgi:hypothetical protein